MDYTSIINLALVTVLYSTFISPNITKLSKLKEDILDLEFPVNVSGSEDIEKIKLKGLVLAKKIAQYGTKYYEIKSFLKYFYFIIAFLTAYQLYRLFFVQGLTVENVVLAASSIIVIFVVIVSVNKYMSPPSRIRSFGWLVHGGVAPIYLKHMYNAKFMVGMRSRNSMKDAKDGIPLSIRSDIGFCGYNYIMTIENPVSDALYYVAAGKTGKYHNPVNLVFDNGRQGAEILLANAKLEEGHYRAKLLFNGGFFQGNQPVYETEIDFSVDSTGAVVSIMSEKLKIGDGSESSIYRFILDGKKRIKSAMVTHGSEDSGSRIEMLLGSELFVRLMNRSKRSIVLEDVSGQIDASFLRSKLTRRNYVRAKVARVLHTREHRTTAYHL